MSNFDSHRNTISFLLIIILSIAFTTSCLDSHERVLEAIQNNNVDTIKKIANRDEVDFSKSAQMYMDEALDLEQFEVIEFFIDNGYSVDFTHNGEHFVRHLIDKKQNEIVLKIFKKYELPYYFTLYSEDMAFYARETDNQELFYRLIEIGQSPFVCDSRNNSILYYIFKDHNIDLVYELINSGLSPYSADDCGRTLYHRALQFGEDELVQDLLSAGIDLQQTGLQEESPWDLLAIYWHDEYLELANYYLESGLPLNGNGTPLHYAAKSLNFEYAEWLIDHGVSKNVKDERGRTPDLDVRQMLREDRAFEGEMDGYEDDPNILKMLELLR